MELHPYDLFLFLAATLAVLSFVTNYGALWWSGVGYARSWMKTFGFFAASGVLLFSALLFLSIWLDIGNPVRSYIS